MPFVVYQPTRRKKREKQALVSFSKNSIVLNKVIRIKLNCSEVELAFDKENKVIRIKKQIGSGIKIKKTKIYGKAFFNFFDIQPIGIFNAIFDEKEEAVFVYLKK